MTMAGPTLDDADELLSYATPPKPIQKQDGESKRHDAETLLTFYRQRCDNFQDERRELLTRMATIGVSKEELHRVKWELQMRKQEMAEMEAALATANDTVFQLRQEKLALETETEALRIQEQDDRRKIQHLLALTQPVTEEVTFFRDCRPGAVASYPPQSRSKPPGPLTYPYPSTMHLGSEEMLTTKKRPSREMGRGGAGSTRRPTSAGTSGKKPHATNPILRTIYMPTDQAEALGKAVSNLQQQLAKQQQLHDDRVQHLLNQFADEKTRLRHELQRLEESNALLDKQATKAQRLLEKTTKDYLVLRHHAHETERATQEELRSLTEKCQELVQEKAEVTTHAMAAADATKEKAKEESTQYTQQLRDEAMTKERDLHILREQYVAVQEACTKRIQDLQTRLTKLRARYRSLDQRRSMEMEGFTRDIAAVRKNLQRLESALYGRRVFVRQQHEPSSRGPRHRNEILESADLVDEIALLQQRIAELAADVDAN